MASGDVPLFLNMPSPSTLSLTVGAARLTAPGDDAARPPLSLATAARLTATVGYEPSGTLSDVSTDSRTAYSVDQPACAEIADTNLLVMKSGAASCSFVTVTVRAYGLTSAATVPLVFLARLDLAFHGYPAGGELPPTLTAGVSFTHLGVVECLPGTYHQASAKVTGTLTDATAYDVTSGCDFASNEETVTKATGSRLETQGVGMATVTAAMAGGAASASGTLLVFDEVLAFSSGLAWSIALQAEETLV